MAISKATLRFQVKESLRLLSATSLSSSSIQLLNQLVDLPSYQGATCVSVFLSMPTEVLTLPIIEHALSNGKKVVVPKIVGKMPQDMLMIELTNYDIIKTFPQSKWGIPEPPDQYILEHPDMTYSGAIDLVLVPGVAFDPRCGRLGHGKGYYDSFLSRIPPVAMGGSPVAMSAVSCAEKDAAANSIRETKSVRPASIGLCFDEQILDHVPMDGNDKFIDCVITPTKKYYSGGKR